MVFFQMKHSEKVQQVNKKRMKNLESSVAKFTHTCIPYVHTHTHSRKFSIGISKVSQ